MINIEGATADDVWLQALAKLRMGGHIQPGRDQPTRELLHTCFKIQDPRQRLVFSLPLNPAFCAAEVLWILGGRDDVEFLAFWNKRMNRWTDDGVRFHGAYGCRLLRHFDGINQLDRAYEAFRADEHTRQVVLQYWDARVDMPDPEPVSADVPCNLVSHPLVRNGKLEWLQVMRSNDLIWGTPSNFIQFTSLQEVLAGWLDLEVGTYNHISDSLHVYKRHWGHLEKEPAGIKWAPKNNSDLRSGREDWLEFFPEMLDSALKLTKANSPAEIEVILQDATRFPEGYYELLVLLASEALRIRRFVVEAYEVIPKAGKFWETSWRKWALVKKDHENITIVPGSVSDDGATRQQQTRLGGPEKPSSATS